MPSGRSIGRAGRARLRGSVTTGLGSIALLALLGTITGCSHPRHTAAATTTTHPPKGSASNPVPPSESSVAAARYVLSVDIDGGLLEVSPPPKDSQPTITATQAASLFDADVNFSGTYAFDLIGLGTATIIQPGSPTSPETPTSSDTSPATSDPATTTSSTTAPGTTPATTGVPTTTTVPPTTTTTIPPFPVYDRRLAWVGIAVGQQPSCATGPPATLAVVIDAYTGQDVLAVAGGACGSPAPTVARAAELESVPWTIVGPSSTAIVARIPACGSYVGWTATGTGALIEVQAQAPYDPECGATATTEKVINLVVPLGSTNSGVPHAPLGPIDNLDVLP
jgi:hypothetical protein